MELRHIRYFLAVAHEANFTRAAKKLGIGQPPLSQQIKQLEAELGVPLFRRTPHGAELTAAGLAFEPEARRLIDGAARAIRAAQRAGLGETGTLRVGFTGSAAFNPVVADIFRRFRRAFPDAELTLVEANTVQLLEGLENDRMDAIFIRPGTARPAGIRLHHFPDEQMRIAVPSDHPLAKHSRATVAALANEWFVLFPRAVGISLYEAVFDACVNAGFTPRLAQEAPQISSVVNLVAAGLGVSIVPAAIAKVKVDGVRYLRIEGPAPVATLALGSREGNADPMLRHFLRLLTDVPSSIDAPVSV